MDENTKEILYKQIVEMYENNLNKTPIVSEQEYMGLSARDALRYIFNYRDTADFGIDEDDGSRITYYIELPDMDLSGEDLTDVKIREFIPGTIDENSRLWPSYINLENTNASIDLNDIGYTNSEENDRGITDYIIDFEMMNFNGCSIRGILPDEYSAYESNQKARFKSQYKTLNKEGHLDESYLQRRSKIHLSERAKNVSDKAYQRIINGVSLKGMVGINDGIINLTDYDLNKLNEMQMEAFVEAITKYKIRIELSMLSQGPVKEQLDKLRDSDIEQYSEIIFKYVKDAINYEDMEFVEKNFEDMTYEMKSQLVLLAYEHDEIEFVEKHFEDMTYEMKPQLVLLAYERNDMELVNRHIDLINDQVAYKIIKNEYDKGNIEFVENHVDSLGWSSTGQELKKLLVQEAYDKGDTSIVEKHNEYLDSQRRALWAYEKRRLQCIA